MSIKYLPTFRIYFLILNQEQRSCELIFHLFLHVYFPTVIPTSTQPQPPPWPWLTFLSCCGFTKGSEGKNFFSLGKEGVLLHKVFFGLPETGALSWRIRSREKVSEATNPKEDSKMMMLEYKSRTTRF